MKNIYIYFAVSLILLFIIIQVSKLNVGNNNQHISHSTTLNIWIQESFSGEDVYFNELKSKFKNKYPNIDIELNLVKGNDMQIYNHLLENILTGNNPDILFLSLQNYNAMATENMLYDLTEYISRYENDYFIPSTINEGLYNDKYYGITYYLDPEIVIYRISHLKNIEIDYDYTKSLKLLTYKELFDYIYIIDNYSNEHNLGYTAFSIPTLTSNGQFINSLLGKQTYDNSLDNKIFKDISSLYKKLKPSPYNYQKTSSHPFFKEENVTFAIEPLSLLYEEINNNYSLKKETGILSINNSETKYSYSLNHYACIYSKTDKLKEALKFFDLFFSEEEIYNRYKYYNIPVTCTSLKDVFINDHNFNNKEIWNYLESAFHYKISPNAKETNLQIDTMYENAINFFYLSNE